ncbi:hypothetical protein SAY86_020334 [Trapa natans]|uniref:Uncharacterized protein n=1 Tax=Trapa natans TaxID=22666 RepID=A0AAN7LN84_TRANT|nr:hypothetical protein SAY86_020334 [Trapa natans]
MRSPTAAPAGGKTATATPCCVKVGLKKGPWTPEEDELLSSYINREGEGRWRTLPKRAGLLRCGKSCRLRWMNYLRPSVKRGQIAPDEEDLILRLHRLLGNRWSLIAGRIPGRTDNEIKNYWNTHLSKKLISQGIDPRTHKPLNPPENGTATSTNTKVAASHKQPVVNQSSSSGTEEADKQPPPVEPNNLTSDRFDDGLVDDSSVMMMMMRMNEPPEDINNCCTDDAFSSFLNSLINDEMFTASHHLSSHHPPPLHGGPSSDHDPLMIPNPISALGLGWESAIMSLGQNSNEAPGRINDQA